MNIPFDPPTEKEPYLLTPGPLTTAIQTRQEMLRDWGSWDDDFRAMTAKMRHDLLALIGDRDKQFDCVPMQGSGTFVIEAMLGSLLPAASKTLVLINGAYGRRIAKILACQGHNFTVLDKGDYLPPRAAEVSKILADDPAITHVVVVHCETSSGILNPIDEISEAVYAAGCKLLIDSMSAFGALELDVQNVQFDAMVSSANKCLEGVPGFGFIMARKSQLQAAEGRSHSLCLDLNDQWQTMNKTGQWRFTPPTHVVAAFMKALDLHAGEGGISGRCQRYMANRDFLVAGMRALGFETLLRDRWLSPIIVTFFNPADKNFVFPEFYQLLKQKGFIIYPGKLTIVDSFRIGCIGHIDEAVMAKFINAAAQCLQIMGVKSAAPPPAALLERARLAA